MYQKRVNEEWIYKLFKYMISKGKESKLAGLSTFPLFEIEKRERLQQANELFEVLSFKNNFLELFQEVGNDLNMV
jgi:hypothetical protein